MNRLPLILVTFAIISWPAGAAEPGTMLALAQNAMTQKELKVSEAQVTKLKAARSEADLKAALKPAQLERLRQLSYQARGGAAILDPAVTKELALSDAQKARALQIMDAKEAKIKQFLMVARFRSAQAMMIYILNGRKMAGEEVLKLLTDAQKKKFKTMQGN